MLDFGKTTKVGGSGIGLPLSQLIVESHGGSLVYRDDNGAGATFRITLPMETIHSNELERGKPCWSSMTTAQPGTAWRYCWKVGAIKPRRPPTAKPH